MRAHSAKLSFYLNNLRLAGGAGGIRANPLTFDYVCLLFSEYPLSYPLITTNMAVTTTTSKAAMTSINTTTVFD